MTPSFRYYKCHTARNRIGRDTILGGGDCVSMHRDLKANGYVRVRLYEWLTSTLAAGMSTVYSGQIIHVLWKCITQLLIHLWYCGLLDRADVKVLKRGQCALPKIWYGHNELHDNVAEKTTNELHSDQNISVFCLYLFLSPIGLHHSSRYPNSLNAFWLTLSFCFGL